MSGNLGAWSGFLGGLVLGGLGWYLGRRMAARQRGLDERFELIEAKAKAAAWWWTFGAMVVAWVLVLSGVQLSVPALLGVLYAVHLAGWTFASLYYNRRYS